MIDASTGRVIGHKSTPPPVPVPSAAEAAMKDRDLLDESRIVSKIVVASCETMTDADHVPEKVLTAGARVRVSGLEA